MMVLGANLLVSLPTALREAGAPLERGAKKTSLMGRAGLLALCQRLIEVKSADKGDQCAHQYQQCSRLKFAA